MVSIEETITSITADLERFDGILIAFSGGVDSSVVAALANKALGEDAIACTAKSETLPETELEETKQIADEIGIRHKVVEFSELDSDAFRRNDEERCYHCRTMRLSAMYDVARDQGIEIVCDGTNASDPGEGHRPGLRAVEELNAYSPLLVHDITKDEVREIARKFNLSVTDKPSMACLSSRIPTGLEVTEERLTRIEKAEQILRTWGFEQFRVRDHDGLARIEVASDELEAALDLDFVQTARKHIADLGFDHVTLDLHGYQTGSVSPETNNAGTDTSSNENSNDPVGEDVFVGDDSTAANRSQ